MTSEIVAEIYNAITIQLPEHEPGPWSETPWWAIPFKSRRHRRINFRWTIDHYGCRCRPYWEYRDLRIDAHNFIAALNPDLSTPQGIDL